MFCKGDEPLGSRPKDGHLASMKTLYLALLKGLGGLNLLDHGNWIMVFSEKGQ